MKPRFPVVADINVAHTDVVHQLTRTFKKRQAVLVVAPYVVGIGLVLNFLGGRARATTIVAIWSHDAVIVAADAIVTTTKERGGEKHRASHVECKIHPVGRSTFIANAGVYSDGRSKIDIVRLIHDIPSESPFSEVIKRLRDRVPAAIRAVASERRTRGVPIVPGEVAAEFIVAGMESGLIKMARFAFEVFPPMELPEPVYRTIEVQYPQPNMIAGDRGIEVIGRAMAIGNYVTRQTLQSDDPNDWRAGPPIEIALRLLNLEIEAAKSELIPGVGPPIAVLVVTRDAVTWHERGACSSIGQPQATDNKEN